MPPSIPEIAQLNTRCSPLQHSRSSSPGLHRPWPVIGAAMLFLLACTTSLAQLKQVNSISSVVGDGTANYSGDGGPASSAPAGSPLGIALDRAGNLYFCDVNNNVVRKINGSTGVITTVAGNGSQGFSGDGGSATSAQLGSPSGVAVDASGNLYIADFANHRVRKVTAAGVISTVTGNGTAGSSGDSGPATSATLSSPQGVALDRAGNLYIADSSSNVVREVNASTGIITTVVGVAGSGSFSGDGGAATSAHLNGPSGMAFDTAGDLYLADQSNNRIRMVSASTGFITTVAGSSAGGTFSGDGGAATSAALNTPYDVKLDGGGNLYISDSQNNRIRMVSATTGLITTVAGNGQAMHAGDYGAATAASLNQAFGMGFDSGGNLYVAELHYVRKVGLLTFDPTPVGQSDGPIDFILQTTADETISGFNVTPSQGNKYEFSVYGVTGCATDGVTVIPAGTTCAVEVRFIPAYPGLRSVPMQAVTSAGKVSIGLNGIGVAPLAALTPGTMSTLAGEVNSPNCNAYNGPALLGPLCNPSGGAVDAAGNVYVASYFSNTISKIDTSGNTTVIAGTGSGYAGGIGGPATSAAFNRPSDVAVDAAGNVYFTDETSQQVFKIDAISQIITSIAGNGNQGYSGDNGPATMATFSEPEAIAVDQQGNIYVEDQFNNLIRKINTLGIITTVAGNPATINQGTTTFNGDGGPATQANLELCCGGVYAGYDDIFVDAVGDLFIGDSGHQVVREVTTDGIIHTVAGNNALGGGFSGDGGAATSAQLNWPMGVTVDAAGNLYIADFSNNRIRRVDAATQTITTVAGSTQGGPTGATGPATQESLNGPQQVRLDGLGNLYIADTKDNLIRKVDVSSSTLTFPTPSPEYSIDTTDGALEAFVSNIGNAPLNLPPPATGSNASVSDGFTFFLGNSNPCPFEGPNSLAAGTLAQGSSCSLSVDFEPASVGTITGSIVLTDNNLNAPSPYVTQTISLVGTAIAATNTGSLTIAPTTQMFASTAVGSTNSTLTSTITNTSGTIYLSAGSLTDATDFSFTTTCSGIIAATTGTCTVTFTFTPQGAGPLTSIFSIHDLNHPNSPLTVVLTGNGSGAAAPQATLTPSSANFGSVTVGSTSPDQTFTLSNTGTTSLGISAISLSGANPGSFTIDTDSCVLAMGASVRPGHTSGAARGRANPSDQFALPPGTYCQIYVFFSPTSAGSAAATLSVVDDAGTQTSTLTGTAVAAAPPPAPQATLTPTSVSFGSFTTGATSAAQTFTLTNSGNATLTISGVTLGGTNASDFAIGTNSCGEALAASATCSIVVTFTPSATGSFSATLSVADNAEGSPQTSSLTGTGAVPADFTVTATPNAQSVSVGSTATYAVSVTSEDGSFTNPVALTATGLPPGAAVTFSPASVTLGSSAATSSMTIHTARQQASAKNGRQLWPLGAPVFAALLLLVPGKKWRAGRRWMNLACFVALLGIAASTIGCGGGFALPSTAKTYTITVTGTSGSDTHSTTVTLTVQ
jgi:sugar lactone lactonase YvrE